jgi:hypothetical protein
MDVRPSPFPFSLKTAMRLPILLAAALALAACARNPTQIDEPVEQTNTFGTLEQELRVSPLPSDMDPSGKMFRLTSRMVNRGDAPVTLRLVHCWLEPGVNLLTEATFIAFAIPSCPGPVPGSDGLTTLAPGEASGTRVFTGEIEFPGTYKFRVRHSLDPELWGEITIRAK